MRWLNYHHLLYFWTVARTGSIAAASRELFLSQPAVSTQIKSLENELGTPLFRRTGRRLTLTEAGQKAYQYADRIFRLGVELREAVSGDGEKSKLRIGVGPMTPKLLASRLLIPLLRTHLVGGTVQFREAPANVLRSLLNARELDLVLLEEEPGLEPDETGIWEVLGRVRFGVFTGAVTPAPAPNWLIPVRGTTLRARLDGWLDAQGIAPNVVPECEDGAMMLELGRAGLGAFAAPLELTEQLQEHSGLRLVDAPAFAFASRITRLSSPASSAR